MGELLVLLVCWKSGPWGKAVKSFWAAQACTMPESVFGGIDCFFIDVIGLVIRKFLFFDAN